MADTTETKIRKGQAFNLAVADAIQEGKQDEEKYILQRYIYYYDLAELLQAATRQDVEALLLEASEG